jgi:hypothetical protein
MHDRIITPGDFQGMQDATAESIKSLEGFRIAWIEEAQALSHRSLSLLPNYSYQRIAAVGELEPPPQERRH